MHRSGSKERNTSPLAAFPGIGWTEAGAAPASERERFPVVRIRSVATWLIEEFVLGIVAYLHALLVAVLAIVVALVIAAYVNRRHGPRVD